MRNYKSILLIMMSFANVSIMCRANMLKPRFAKITQEQLKQQQADDKKRLIETWEKNSVVKNKAIIDAFNKVPRELFVKPEHQRFAYLDRPLPIPANQTISQPSTVVLMLDAIDIKPGQKILEVGAGSGYNAAMLATIIGNTGKVVSTEIIPELAEFAKDNLKKANINNVTIVLTDGSKGYAQEAPYDRIIVTAAAPSIPQAIIDQLKEGGVLLIPVGDHPQKMTKVKKNQKVETEDLGTFEFVPLTGEFGKKPEK